MVILWNSVNEGMKKLVKFRGKLKHGPKLSFEACTCLPFHIQGHWLNNFPNKTCTHTKLWGDFIKDVKVHQNPEL